MVKKIRNNNPKKEEEQEKLRLQEFALISSREGGLMIDFGLVASRLSCPNFR
jgi:hypothetical protein